MRSELSQADATHGVPTEISRALASGAAAVVSGSADDAVHSTVHGTMQSAGAMRLTLATLFDDPLRCEMVHAVKSFLRDLGVDLEPDSIPADLARGGAVGRIGVPREAELIMRRQRVVFGAGCSELPLAPVARMWRGLQRRADVIVDVRRCATLPGSAAQRAGTTRDVLLVTQRVIERSLPHAPSDSQRADHWARARESAEIVYRIAAAEQRCVLLVRPIGRGTGAQQGFADALERYARAQRLPAPREVKAGLLAALLSGASGETRWLAASVMPIDELSALVTESIGDTGAWPLVSVGRTATFYDMPVAAVCAHDPVPIVLAIVDQLQRRGQVVLARAMFDALVVTSAAVVRMREELGGVLHMPASAFLDGMRANWGRSPVDTNTSRRGAEPPRRARKAPTSRFRIEPGADRPAAPLHVHSVSA
jgi:hypothetical protein